MSEEKSAEAAAVADFDTCFATLEADRLVLKWMVGLVIAAEVLPPLLLEGVARLYEKYEAGRRKPFNVFSVLSPRVVDSYT